MTRNTEKTVEREVFEIRGVRGVFHSGISISGDYSVSVQVDCGATGDAAMWAQQWDRVNCPDCAKGLESTLAADIRRANIRR